MKQRISRFRARYHYSVILLKQLVRTDFKLRYQNSILGYLWTLLRPLFLFAILYVVFVKILKTGGDVPHFGVYLLLGIVIWNFFLETTAGSVGSIVSKGDVMRKANFPRYVIVLAVAIAAFINLVFNFVVVAIFMIIAKTQVNSAVVFLPLLLLELFVFTVSLSFLLSALYVKFRDIGFIWEVGMQGAFFAVPIMYSFSLVTTRSKLLGKILISNPVAQLMQDARYMLISTKTETVYNVFHSAWGWAIPIGIVVSVSLLSVLYFKRSSPGFAEDV
jgi:ABC-2 type transport system permease protein